ATLPLSQFTLIVGPNGSGKSTAMQALQAVGDPQKVTFANIVTAGSNPKSDIVEVIVNWGKPFLGKRSIAKWSAHPSAFRPPPKFRSGQDTPEQEEAFRPGQTLHSIQIYSLDPQAIAEPTFIDPNI